MKYGSFGRQKRTFALVQDFMSASSPGWECILLDSLTLDINSLETRDGIHRLRRNHYRFLPGRFPFWIYYRIDKELIYVVAVLDVRQEPQRILRREIQEQSRSKQP